jgi:ParB family chromosome partitioning protein
MSKKNSMGLGKGLDVIFSMDDEPITTSTPSELDIDKVTPDPNQHRKVFIEETLDELAASIKLHGILQPIVVREVEGNYVIIAGERRWRAAKRAGLEKVPVIVRELTDREAAELALIENLQREDLNPVDEAEGYATLINTFGITQEEAADRVGRSRPTVANALRLLKLPAACLEALKDKRISAGHARAILSLKTEPDMNELLYDIIDDELSVREAEARAKTFYESREEKKKADKPFSISDEYLATVSRRAGEYLSRKVVIKPRGEGKKGGKLVLSWSDTSDLENLLETLCGEKFVDDLDS